MGGRREWKGISWDVEISRREAGTLLDGTKICIGYIQTLKRQSVEVNDLTFEKKKKSGRGRICAKERPIPQFASPEGKVSEGREGGKRGEEGRKFGEGGV